MLLIGDIHINKKQQTAILSRLQSFVKQFPDERHLVFLGDYVYHFTYERSALLALFGFFVELLREGKEVWVMAGNHDWLQGHFVFDEARQLCEALGKDTQRLHIITQPHMVEIEGQHVLFLPFCQFQEPVSSDSPYALLESADSAQSRQSARVNDFLHTSVQQRRLTNPQDILHIFHHRYIADTSFPGQQSRFSYTSPALDAKRLEAQDIRLLSGHLHSAFGHKNYFCTGSIWYTSPLEVNEVKWLFRYSPSKLEAIPCTINPYLLVEATEKPLSIADLNDIWDRHVRQSILQLSAGSSWQVEQVDGSIDFPIAQTTLTIRTPVVEYASLPELVDTETQRILAEVKLKSTQQLPSVLMADVNDASLQLSERVSDWKVLLERYITAKWGENAPKYRKLLQELQLV